MLKWLITDSGCILSGVAKFICETNIAFVGRLIFCFLSPPIRRLQRLSPSAWDVCGGSAQHLDNNLNPLMTHAERWFPQSGGDMGEVISSHSGMSCHARCPNS